VKARGQAEVDKVTSRTAKKKPTNARRKK